MASTSKTVGQMDGQAAGSDSVAGQHLHDDANASECIPCRQAEHSAVGATATTSTSGTGLPLEAATLPTPGVIIEYCDRCRWGHRASWLSTELLATFPTPRPRPLDASEEEQRAPLPAGLRSIILLPRTGHAEGGIFRVTLSTREGDQYDPEHIPDEVRPRREQTRSILLWDRKTEGRFPEPKELKQKIRDIISPNQSLGHSDR